MPCNNVSVVILDVANLKSVQNFAKNFPKAFLHLVGGRIKTASGGSLFKKELQGASTFMTLYLELNRSGKLVTINDEVADQEVENFNLMIAKEFGKQIDECDDPHLFSLLKLSNATTVISYDKRLSVFI